MTATEAVETFCSPEDLTAICTDVWVCFLGEEPTSGLDEVAGPIADEFLLAAIGITGAWNGHVVLELGVAEANQAARSMLGAAEVTSAEVVDAVGELVNMVGGNFKSLLPAPSALGLPLVVSGRDGPLSGGGLVEVARAELDWAGAPFRVTVWQSTVQAPSH